MWRCDIIVGHVIGGIGERSNPADCKSAAKASKVQILLPPPFIFICQALAGVV